MGQDEPTEPARSTISHTRDHDDIRSTRTRDHDDIRNTHNRDHDDIRDTRIRDHDVRDTRTRDLHDNRDRAGTSDATNDLHMKMTGEIAATCSGIHTIME